MTTKERFLAAVDVIKSIPYDGTFEPSDEIMLKFYAYQMQVTEGPCKDPKPFIWNTVARNKWNAWNELGDMSAEAAMENYIEELSKVIETMSYNEKIAKFISLMGSFYEVVSSDEGESQRDLKNLSAQCPEEMFPAAIFKNYQSPTISDLYHITKNRPTPLNQELPIEKSIRCPQVRESSQSLPIVKYDSSDSHPSRFHSQSSSLSSSCSSSEESNLNLLSDSSGSDSDPLTEKGILRLFKKNQNCNEHHILAKEDLFVLTFINLQTSMEDILVKLENLSSLAENERQEKNFQVLENSMPEWDLNLTGTAFALLWPVVIGIILE